MRLKVHSNEEAHGLKLNLYPEGSKDKSSQGLLFANLQENGKVQKGEGQVLDFVAQRAGTCEWPIDSQFRLRLSKFVAGSTPIGDAADATCLSLWVNVAASDMRPTLSLTGSR